MIRSAAGVFPRVAVAWMPRRRIGPASPCGVSGAPAIAADAALGRILSPVPEAATPRTRTETKSAAAPEAAAVAPKSRGLRDFWQLPLLLLGVGGVAGAIWYARAHPPENDFAGALAQAEELVTDGELAAAKVVLFDVVGANIEKAPPEVLPRYHAVSADYVAAQVRGIEKPARENDEQVVAAYDRAKTSGWTLTSDQLVRYAQSMVRLGRAQEAFEAIEASGDASGAEALRRQVRRDALLGVLSGTSGAVRSPEALLAAIDEFRADPALSAADEAWAAARAAEIRIAMRRYTDASDRLLIDLRRIEGAGEEVPAPLFAELGGLLGESLRLQGRFAEALREFEHAQGLAQSGTPVAGAIDVGMGRALLALGRHAEADEAFDRAVKAEHRGALRHLALLGRAESRALSGRSSESARDFQEFRGFVHKGDVLPETVTDAERALLERADACLLDEEPEAALLYAQIAADLRPRAAAGAAALLRVATSSRETADKLLAATGAASSAAATIDPEDRAKINRLLKQAGDAFAAHAATSEARAAQDGAFAASLWAAADCYDLAGWRDPAIGNFQAFVDASQPEDLRRAEAYWRLASLNHAEGAFDEAVKGYERAIAVAPNGPFAVQSVVPLARALASSGRTADAAQRLQGVVDGTFGLEPSAAEYYEALDLLARISFEKGDFVRSAEALREAIARRPDEPRVGELNFRLGESLRSVAREAREAAAKGDVSEARRLEFARDAAQRLEEARRSFEAAIVALAAREDSLDGLAADMLREAHLSRAHCAYDLGKYDDAISLYEAVDRKYPEHASSMIALIQIVNCCDALGDEVRSETAHRRAQLRLAQLPDEAFLAGGGILARESWERWLANHPPAGRRAIASGAEPAEGGSR